MSQSFPPPPETGACLAPTRPHEEARAFLALRRSAGKMTLQAPGPSPDELDELLRVAARVPDHRRLEPWRFIVFEGEVRAAIGETLQAIKREDPQATPDEIDAAAGLLLRAPCVVAVVSSPDKSHKTPVWEQELSCGAVCYNLLLAANAAGWAGVWLSEWIAFDRNVDAALELAENERLAGFIYLGTASAESPERPRPDIAAKITRWAK